MKEQKKKKNVEPKDECSLQDRIDTDPFGSYTGCPDNPYEEPVQDVDDL